MTKKLQKTTILSIFLVFLLICTSFLLVGCFNKTILPERLELEKESDTLYLNEIKTISYSVYPKKAKNYKLNFSSSDYSIVKFDKNANMVATGYGEATITIKVIDTNISQSMKVVVGDGEINYIDLEYPTSATYYFDGEKIDLSQIEVYGHYESGKEVLLPISECKVEHPRFAYNGATIKITYKDLPTQIIPLTVRPDKAMELIIDSLPNKTSYYIGEKFDTTGLEVSLKYYSGKIEKLTDYQIDKDTIDVGDNKVTIKYGEFSKELSITTKAKKTVNSFSQLQEAVKEENIDSIMIAVGAKFNTASPLIIENRKNLTIYAERKTDLLNGIEIIPVKIIGNIENVRFINFTISSTGESPAQNLIDMTECSGGNVTFKEMNFLSSQQNAIILPKDIDLSITFNNCTFTENNN